MRIAGSEHSTKQPVFQLGHRPALDGIRGLAILAVMLFHLYLPLNDKLMVFGGGYFGVDVFFVLSGFLITSLLIGEWERTGKIGLRRFYVRRARRLLPALLCMLFILVEVVAVASIVSDRAFDEVRLLVKAVPATLFYVTNWAEAFRWFDLKFLSMTWSLSMEEQFYLAWPFLLLGLLRRGVSHRGLLLLAVSGASAAFLWRTFLFLSGTDTYRLYFAFDTRADSILIGCALGLIATGGYLPAGEQSRRWLARLAYGGLGAIAFAIIVVPSMWSLQPLVYTVGFTGIALAAALVIAHILVEPKGHLASLFSWAPLTWMGRLSYGLYLWHSVIFVSTRYYLAPALFGQDHVDRFGFNAPSRIAAIALSFAAAVASYYLLERRFLGRVPETRKTQDITSPAGAPALRATHGTSIPVT
jgi:peptidoglycan/LPS O-acetylase OafA/YrhL